MFEKVLKIIAWHFLVKLSMETRAEETRLSIEGWGWKSSAKDSKQSFLLAANSVN